MKVFSNYSQQDFDANWEDGAVIGRVSKLCDEVIDLMRGDKDLYDRDYIRKISRSVSPTEYDHSEQMIVRGSLIQLMMVSDYYMSRIKDDCHKEELAKIVREEFIRVVDEMRIETEVELRHLESHGTLCERGGPV